MERDIKGGQIEIEKGGVLVIGGDGIKIEDVEINSSGEESVIIAINKKDLEIKRCKIKGGLGFIESEGKIEDCELYDSKIEYSGDRPGAVFLIGSKFDLRGVKIFNNHYYGVYSSENSYIKLTDCEIYENGKEKDNYPQLLITSSGAEIIDSRIHSGNNSAGVVIKGSKVDISGSIIYGNHLGGLLCGDGSYIKLYNCKIYENGNIEKISNQIVIDKSTADILNTFIFNGLNSTGIVISKSKVRMSEIKVFGNTGGIGIMNGSDAKIESSDIYENGDEIYHLSQIGIFNSVTEMINCQVFRGLDIGIYVDEESKTLIRESRIYGNGREGIWVNDSASILNLYSVRIFNNKGGIVIPSKAYKFDRINCQISDINHRE